MMSIPPPPPRNRDEMMRQIRQLERDIAFTRALHLFVVASGAVGIIIIVGMIVVSRLP